MSAAPIGRMANVDLHMADDCLPVARVLACIGDKWSILLIDAINDDTLRFKDLRRAVPGISERMLTVTLRNLERDGVIERQFHPTIPPRVEYRLTDRGRSLRCAVLPIARWAADNREGIEESRQRFDAARKDAT